MEPYCTIPLHHTIAPYHCTIPLHHTIAPYHCLYSWNDTTLPYPTLPLPYLSPTVQYHTSVDRMRVQQRIIFLVAAFPALAAAFAPRAITTKSKSSTSTGRLFSSSTAATSSLDEGLLKTITVPGQGNLVKLGDIATVQYTCYLPNDTTAVPFAKSSKQKIIVGDGGMVDGWEKAVRTMRIGERSIVRITNPELAYGAAGVPPLIPPNAPVEFDLKILDSQPAAMNIDFDTLAMAENIPRTAGDIAQAYRVVQDAKALEGPELEGLEKWIKKAKSFYFFGLFEGETGEKAPWFLRPSITFPLAFSIVGAAFYVSYIGGAISERGAQVTDELDEIVLSSIGIVTGAGGGGGDHAASTLLAMNVLLQSLSTTTTNLGM